MTLNFPDENHDKDQPTKEVQQDLSVIYDGLTIQLIPAPFLKRLMAYTIDLGIISAIYLPLFFILAFLAGIFGSILFPMIRGEEFENLVSPLWFILFLLIALVILLVIMGVYHGYFVYFEHKRGFTPGKKFFGLKVVSLRVNRLTWGQCIWRDLFRYIDGLLLLPGLISIVLSQKHQRLGDLAAGTMVVYSPQKESSDDYMYISQEEYQLLRENLAPVPAPKEFCRNYLEFFYPYFITRKSRATVGDLNEWEATVLTYLPKAKSMGLDQETVLLFFAEHCFQLLKQS